MTWIDPEKFQYLSQWKYVEIAHYVPKLDRVIRDQVNKVPIMIEWSEVAKFTESYGNTGCYTSVWLYDNRDIDEVRRWGSLYFDLDSDDPEASRLEAVKLVDYLRQFIPQSAIRVYFSGAKGFHIECEAIVLGITPSNQLPNLFRYIAESIRDDLSLHCLDFSVYDQRRMWRIPNTIHQKSNLYKIPLITEQLQTDMETIKDLAKDPIYRDVTNLEFNAIADAWYREWSYKQETTKEISLEERIARFNKHGTNIIHKADDSDLIFDPESLFKHCPAILRLWTKAETEHHLLHEERLFLCSILTYTDEAIDYLIQILSNCYDFNLEKSKSHIDDWVRRREMDIGGRPFSCKRANSVGAGCMGCELAPKERMERVGNNLVGTGEFAEVSPIRYAYHKRSGVPKNPVTIDQESIKRI